MRSRGHGTRFPATADAVTAAWMQGGRREHCRPPQWKRPPERGGGGQAAGKGKATGRRCGQDASLGPSLWKRPRAIEAPRPNSVGPSQTKVAGGPRGRLRSRGRTPAVRFAVACKPAQAVLKY